MSNSVTCEDFYQVPDLTFDINKLRSDLEKILKNEVVDGAIKSLVGSNPLVDHQALHLTFPTKL